MHGIDWITVLEVRPPDVETVEKERWRLSVRDDRVLACLPYQLVGSSSKEAALVRDDGYIGGDLLYSAPDFGICRRSSLSPSPSPMYSYE